MARSVPASPIARVLIAAALLMGSALAALPGSAFAGYVPARDAAGLPIEPHPVVEGNVTVSQHKPAKCNTDVLCYEDDSGTVQNLATKYGFSLNNERVKNPIQFKPQSLDCQYYGEDSDRKSTTSAWCANLTSASGASQGISWLDPAKWTKANEANDTFEVVIRNGAHALRIRNPGGATGNAAEGDTYTLDFTDVITDALKHRFIIGVEVVSRSSSIGFNVFDTDNTGYNAFKVAAATTDAAKGNTHFIANGTGTVLADPVITQGEQTSSGVRTGLSKITVNINAVANTGATEIYIYALALSVKRFSPCQDHLGNPVYNMTYADQDGVYKATPQGPMRCAVFNPNFDYQNARDMKVAFKIEAGALPDDRWSVALSSTGDSAYPQRGAYRFRYFLPDVADTSYDGTERVRYTLPVPGSQHERLLVNGADVVKSYATTKAGALVILSTAPPLDKDFEVESQIKFTTAQYEAVTVETGPFFWLPADHFLNRFWVALGSLAIVGALFIGRRRVRRGGR